MGAKKISQVRTDFEVGNHRRGEVLFFFKRAPRNATGINLVVPPPVTKKVVEEAIRLGVKYYWMQPGAESQKAIARLEREGLPVLHNVCVMEERRRRGK